MTWSSAGATEQRCLNYEPARVELAGKVVLRTFFGPPNYGENPDTDSRETQALLELDQPVCVAADPADEINSETERNQQVVTLVPPSAVRMKQYAGKSVVVRGTLYHAHTAHHHTRILITIEGTPDIQERPNQPLQPTRRTAPRR